MNDEEEACLCDLGLATFSEEQSFKWSSIMENGLVGTAGRQAPEMLSGACPTGRDTKTDVFAFGVTMEEVCVTILNIYDLVSLTNLLAGTHRSRAGWRFIRRGAQLLTSI